MDPSITSFNSEITSYMRGSVNSRMHVAKISQPFINMTSTISIVPGRTSRSRNVIHEGYRYCLNRKRSEKSYWKCVDKTCPGRLTLLDDATVTSTKIHTHPPTPAANSVHIAKQKLKQKAASTDHPTKHLVADVVGTLSFEALSKLNCQQSSLAKMARSARAAANRTRKVAQRIQITDGQQPPNDMEIPRLPQDEVEFQ